MRQICTEIRALSFTVQTPGQLESMAFEENPTFEVSPNADKIVNERAGGIFMTNYGVQRDCVVSALGAMHITLSRLSEDIDSRSAINANP